MHQRRTLTRAGLASHAEDRLEERARTGAAEEGAMLADGLHIVDNWNINPLHKQKYLTCSAQFEDRLKGQTSLFSFHSANRPSSPRPVQALQQPVLRQEWDQAGTP